MLDEGGLMRVRVKIRWIDIATDLLEVIAYTEDGFTSVPMRVYGKALNISLIESWLAHAVRDQYKEWKSRVNTETGKLIEQLEEMDFEL